MGIPSAIAKFPKNDQIDKNSPLPYYIQLKEILKGYIENGDWKTGSQIPSEPDLCEIFDISRTVVRQALKELTYEGLLVREKGRGTFVAEPKISEGLIQELTGFYQDMTGRGMRPESQILKQHVVSASARIANSLAIPTGTPVIEIERLRFVNQEPIVLVTTYLPYARCPALVEADLRQRSLYEFIEQECDLYIDRGRRTIEAVPANEYEAQLLQVEEGSPLILLDSVSYLQDGTPVEYYHALHRGDRSRFEVELVRRREFK
ncbi:MAG TPA: GntR family transcriptional regulator [Anaerolineales bacterium]|jgi:GntR family transcriptional regulator|nr:GntR family transcriptional regulator [Anaerolineales bacterium]